MDSVKASLNIVMHHGSPGALTHVTLPLAPTGSPELLLPGSAGSPKSVWSTVNVMDKSLSCHLANIFTKGPPFRKLLDASFQDEHVR